MSIFRKIADWLDVTSGGNIFLAGYLWLIAIASLLLFLFDSPDISEVPLTHEQLLPLYVSLSVFAVIFIIAIVSWYKIRRSK